MSAFLENFIKNNKKCIGCFLIFLAILAPLFFFIVGKDVLGSAREVTKLSGSLAMLTLWIILWMPIFARVFGIRLFALMLPLGKELGILMGVLAVVHGMSFGIPNQEYMNSPGAIWGTDGPTFLFFGIIAMWLSILLTLTSNTWAMRKMGRYWKYLHRLVYILVIFAVAHVAILKGEVAPYVVFGIYLIFKVLEWRGFSFAKK